MVDFNDTAEEAAFRAEVREFLEAEYEPLRAGIRKEARASDGFELTPTRRTWFRTLSDRGWVAPAWPEEYGGAGLPVKQQFIFNEETAERRALRPGGIAIGMVGPTIITIGTDDQQADHLPGILSGEVVWCQGYSEPGAGSDLASLETRAVKDGDDYIVNGQKIWTSGAHRADWMILLARTDPDAPKHKGITYFMLDMHAPGVQVQPLVNMADTHEFNEVFFEDVRIPAKNVLGEENRGWYGAVTTLDFERSSIGSAVGMRQNVEALIDFAKSSDQSALGRRGVATQRAGGSLHRSAGRDDDVVPHHHDAGSGADPELRSVHVEAVFDGVESARRDDVDARAWVARADPGRRRSGGEIRPLQLRIHALGREYDRGRDERDSTQHYRDAGVGIASRLILDRGVSSLTGGLHPPEIPRTRDTREPVVRGTCEESWACLGSGGGIGRAYGSGVVFGGGGCMGGAS